MFNYVMKREARKESNYSSECIESLSMSHPPCDYGRFCGTKTMLERLRKKILTS
jgi:hypothetical protein